MALCRWSDWPSAFPVLSFLCFPRETRGRCCKLTTSFIVKADEKWGWVNLPVTALVYTLWLCSATWLYPLRSANKKSEGGMKEVLWRMSLVWDWPVESPLVLREFDMLKADDLQDLYRKLKVHMLQSKATASALDISFIICTLSNFLLIHFFSSVIFKQNFF